MRLPKLLLIQVFCLCSLFTQAQDHDSLLNIPNNANQELPPGVPRIVETNGQVLFIDGRFTTQAYEEEGLRLVVAEANKVAVELNLNEVRPLTISNLTQAFISPFGYTYETRKIGNITTTNYSYGIEQNCKFSDLNIANYEKRSLYYRANFNVSASEINTNAAYQLAKKWLLALHMDVNGLNRDCDLKVVLTSDLDGSERPHGKITPVYFVSWTPRVKMDRYDRGAYVELFLPTKTLLQLSVSSQRYILRSPVVFTNLAALFPGKAAITTNQPVETITIDAAKMFPIVEPKWPTNQPPQ